MPRRRTFRRRVLDFFAEIATALLILFFTGWDVPEHPRRQHLLNKARARRCDRALRRWLRKTQGVGPIPNVGLKCEKCRFNLAGLVDRRCPECGCPFEIAELLDSRYS